MRLGAGFIEVLPQMAGFTPQLTKGVNRATAKADGNVLIKPELAKFAGNLSKGVTDAARKATPKIEPTAETGKFKRKLESDSDDAGKKGGKRFGSSFSSGIGKIALGSALGGGLLAAAGELSGAFKDAFAEAQDAAKTGAVTEAIIKSTGGAAKVSAKDISDYAGALSNKIGVDDEAIQAGQNLLLTFKGVKNEGAGLNAVFDRATAAGADLAAAGFGSIEGNAKMLGKALNDPTKGLTALTRAGVTFTADQQKQIKAMQKSGDMLGAQKIILKEVETQVGGTAEASVTAADKAQVGWGNFLESLGTMAMPAVDGLLGFFNSTLLPGIQGVFKALSGEGDTGLDPRLEGFIVGVKDAATGLFTTFQTDVLPVLQQLWSFLETNLLPVFQTVFQFLKDNPETVKAFALALGIMVGVIGLVTAAQWLWNAALTANPIGIIVVLIAALVAGIVYAWTNFETFRNVVTAVWAAVSAAAIATGKFILDVVNNIVGFFTKTLPDAFKTFLANVKRIFDFVVAVIVYVVKRIQSDFNKVVNFFKVTVPNAFLYLLAQGKRIFNLVVSLIVNIVRDIQSNFNKVVNFFRVTIPNAMGAFRDKVASIFNSVKDKISAVWNDKIKPVLESFRTFPEKILKGFQTMRDKVGGVLDGIKKAAAIPVNFVIDKIYNNGIREMINLIPGVEDLPKANTIAFAKGGVMPGYTPGRDVHKFYSPTGGGLELSGGEAIMRPEFTRAIGGAAGVAALNSAARQGNKELMSVLLGGSQKHAGGGLVSFKGGTFTEQFAGVLQAVAKQKDFNLFQGGFRPTTSYSGTSHAGDAIDVGPVSADLVRLLRDYGIAAWDRTGMGNWAPHIHGVPLPGVGNAGGSASWQAQDYLNGGNGLSGADNGAGSGYRPGINKAGGGFTFVGDFFDAITKLPGLLTDLKKQFDELTNSGFGKIVKDAVTSSMRDAISWVNEKIPGPGPLPGFASGGVAVKGGWARVGENGPENVMLPGGARVYPNGSAPGASTKGMMIEGRLDLGNGLEGYLRGIVVDEVRQESSYKRTLSRMRG